jgi:hypothetical protein
MEFEENITFFGSTQQQYNSTNILEIFWKLSGSHVAELWLQ